MMQIFLLFLLFLGVQTIYGLNFFKPYVKSNNYPTISLINPGFSQDYFRLDKNLYHPSTSIRYTPHDCFEWCEIKISKLAIKNSCVAVFELRHYELNIDNCSCTGQCIKEINDDNDDNEIIISSDNEVSDDKIIISSDTDSSDDDYIITIELDKDEDEDFVLETEFIN